MEIKASDVKALRDKTGAGMMECKKALVDSNGDPAAAEKLEPIKKQIAACHPTGRGEYKCRNKEWQFGQPVLYIRL